MLSADSSFHRWLVLPTLSIPHSWLLSPTPSPGQPGGCGLGAEGRLAEDMHTQVCLPVRRVRAAMRLHGPVHVRVCAELSRALTRM